MGAGGGWREEHPDHRPGRAAAAAIAKTGRPGRAGLVINRPALNLGPTARKSHVHLTSLGRRPRHRHGTLGGGQVLPAAVCAL